MEIELIFNFSSRTIDTALSMQKCVSKLKTQKNCIYPRYNYSFHCKWINKSASTIILKKRKFQSNRINFHFDLHLKLSINQFQYRWMVEITLCVSRTIKCDWNLMELDYNELSKRIRKKQQQHSFCWINISLHNLIKKKK